MPKKPEGLNDLLELMSTVESIDPAIIEMMYAAFMARFDPILEALPRLGRNLGEDLSPAAAGLLGVIAGIGEGEALQEQAAAIMGSKAKIRGAYLRALIESGFERHEAMAIIVSEAAKQPQFSDLMKSVSVSKAESPQAAPAPAIRKKTGVRASAKRPTTTSKACANKGGRKSE